MCTEIEFIRLLGANCIHSDIKLTIIIRIKLNFKLGIRKIFQGVFWRRDFFFLDGRCY